MAGRGYQKNTPCDGCKRYLDNFDGKLKCFFSHLSSNFRHGVTIIQNLTIHDSCCCGKESSYAGTKTTTHLQEGTADSVGTLSGSHDDATQSFASERSASCQRRNSSRHGDKAKNATSSFSPEESAEDSPSQLRSLQSDHEKILSDVCYFSSRCYLTPGEKVEIADLVKNIQPEFPVLVTQMKKSNLRRHSASLVISKDYAVKHFPEESQIITLERPGLKKKWHPKFHIRLDRRGYLLCGHWADFVHDNDLKENDVCIFQPRGNKSSRVTVHLIPKACSRSLKGHAHRSNKCGTRILTSTGHAQEKSGGKSLSLVRHGCQELPVSDDSGGPSQPPPFVVLGSTKLTPAQEKIVEEKVKAIGSDVPIFVAISTKKIVGDNGTSLDFATRYGTPHLPYGKQTLTFRRTEWSKAWPVKMRNRQTFPGELREFAHDNRLLAGDLCLFEPMKNERLAMMVHLIRSEQYC